MSININYARFPGAMDREHRMIESIYYVVRTIYVVILIVGTLLVLGGI